ncbi:hypothetical protein ALC60_13671, partial [Trachymyrmex zeteki]
RARRLDSTSDRLGNGQGAYPSEQIERKAQEIRRDNDDNQRRLVELRAAAIRRRCLFTLSCHPFDIVAIAGSRFRFG